MHYSWILWLYRTNKRENYFVLQKYKNFGVVEIIEKSTKNSKGSSHGRDSTAHQFSAST